MSLEILGLKLWTLTGERVEIYINKIMQLLELLPFISDKRLPHESDNVSR